MSVSLIDGHIDPDTNKMTDNEIIKALECCGAESDCDNCPYFKNKHRTCGKIFNTDVLDLINRQKEEIERLQKLLDDKCDRCIAKERAEAVKDLLDNLIHISVCKTNGDGTESLYVSIPKARQVVKEMVGEG